MATPLMAEPLASVAPANRPSIIIEKYSAGPNWKATSTRMGENRIMTMMPTLAPTKDASTSMNSAEPDLPRRASGLPSRQVTAWDGVPGRFSRMQVMPPPYWAP
ncbi:Uncharacterised protein [Achromobacter xylosoxidans]|nr:Uncharacterised protein [Achromobacter xylosoxidans]CUJ34427.1 Uncharacterised protein [Achromobacter xylosoxidans]